MLIWSRAAPDELAIGHFERLAILNGASHRRRFNRALEHWRIERGGGDPSVTGMIGVVTTFGESARDYVRSHAWLPNDQVLMRMKRFAKPGKRHAIRPSLRTLAPKYWKSRFFCRKCALEEQDIYQFSYWHRLHQFSGIIHCERHGVGLSYVAHDNRPFLPHHRMDHAHEIDGRLAAAVIRNPVVSRYRQIAQRLLELEIRIPYRNAFGTLSSQCRALGQFGMRKSWSEWLRRKALADLPESWLKECFSDDLHRDSLPAMQYRNILSDPDWTVIRLKEYALALAILYESPDQAFRFLKF